MLPIIIGRIDVLTPFHVEKIFSEIAFVGEAVKIIKFFIKFLLVFQWIDFLMTK